MTALSRIGVDVLDLNRIGRIAGDFGPAADVALLDAAEQAAVARLDAPERARALAAALGTKEAWLKARGRRPDGWRFPDARYVPEAGRPGHVDAVIGRFLDDLDVHLGGAGTVHDGWAWHAYHHQRWLVAAVIA